MKETVDLQWKRPESLKFPKIWLTFKAKDIDSDELVEYCIQDLPESRFQDAMDFMLTIFCKDEPVSEAYELQKDLDAMEDFESFWLSIIQQKCVFVCFKSGLDKIIGLQFNYVNTKNDNFYEKLREKCKSDRVKKAFDVSALLYINLDPFEHFNVEEYLAEGGLAVVREYRGRGIGEQLLRSRNQFSRELGFKMTLVSFTSNYSNRNADKAGFKLNVKLSYDDIRNNHPELELPPVKSDFITLKSIIY